MESIFSKIKYSLYCERGILVGLCIFSAFICLSVSFMEVGIILALICWLFTLKKRKEFSLNNFFSRTPLVKPWLVYITVAVVSSLFALNSARAFAYLPSDLIKAVASIFLICIIDKKNFETLTTFYLLGAGVSAVLGITTVLWEYFFGSGVFSRGLFLVHPVTYGELISLALILVIVMFVEAPSTIGKYAYLALVFVFAGALILSQSRGAMAATVVSVVFLWVINRRARVFLTVLSAVGIFTLFLVAAKDRIFAERIFSVPKAVYAKISGAGKNEQTEHKLDVSSSVRLIQWNTGLEIIEDYPVFGVGPSNVKTVFHAYYPHSIDGQFGWGNLHNLYIHQAAERGLAGFTALVYLFISMFTLAWRLVRTNRNVHTMWCLCTLPGFFVMNLTETSFQHAVVAMSVFLLIALSHASTKNNSIT